MESQGKLDSMRVRGDLPRTGMTVGAQPLAKEQQQLRHTDAARARFPGITRNP